MARGAWCNASWKGNLDQIVKANAEGNVDVALTVRGTLKPRNHVDEQ